MKMSKKLQGNGLLPTPTTGDRRSKNSKQQGINNVIEGLLPTPRAGNPGSRPNKKGGKILAEVVATSSPGASPVSLFPKPDRDEARKTTAFYGRKCFVLLKSLNRCGLSVRMLAEYLLLRADWYSNKCALIWRQKVTPFSRLLFQLSPVTLRTEETGSGLLRTPTASEGEGGAKTDDKYWNAKQPKLKLRDQIAKAGMLPTPQARDSKNPNTSETPRIKRKKKKGWTIDLNDKIGMLNTPSTSMYKGVVKNKTVRDRTDYDIEKNPDGSKTGLKLQPNFVEWMMGYPSNWTDLNSPKLDTE